MRKVLYFILVAVLSFMQGCSQSNPKNDDLVGTWKANDGALFNFNSNGTFSCENLSGKKMFERNEYDGKKYSESGTWELKSQSGRWKIYLSFNKVGDSKGGVGSQLNVKGEKGISSNKQSWYLFKYVGDPDDGEIYGFRKSK